MTARSRIAAVLFLIITSFARAQEKPAADLPAGAIARFGATSFRHADYVSSIVFSPDGKRIASGCSDGVARVWDPTGRQLDAFDTKERFADFLHFTPDGKKLIVGSIYGTAYVWEPGSGAKPLAITVSPKRGMNHVLVHDLALAPDGRTFVSVADDRAAHLWRTENGEEICSIEVAPVAAKAGEKPAKDEDDDDDDDDGKAAAPRSFEAISGAAFLPDGKTVALAGADDHVRLWKLETGALQALPGIGHAVIGVAVSADGKRLAACARDRIVLFDLATEKTVRVIRLRVPASWGGGEKVTFSPDGKILAATEPGLGFVRLWSVETGKALHATRLGGAAMAIAFSPDGKTFAAGSWGDNLIRLWDVATWKETTKASSGPPESWVGSIAIAPDGKTLAVGTGGGVIHLLDPETGSEKKRLSGSSAQVMSLVFTADGQELAAGCGDNVVRLWDVATGEAHTIHGHEKAVFPVALSPDGNRLASSGFDGTTRIVDAREGKLTRKIEESSESLASSPDGKTLACGKSGRVVLCDFATGDEVRSLAMPGTGERICGLAFSRDGKLVVAGSDDAKVAIFEAATGKLVRAIDAPAKLRTIAISSDGTRIAGGAWEKSVFVWATESGKLLHTFEGHGGFVSVVFTPDGKRLISGGQDATVIVWDVSGAR
jgi:WD40 repeat protein